jgi:hypothetical protein
MFPVRIDTSDALAKTDVFADWLREHKVLPEDTFQVVLDGEWMVVFQYAHDGDGSKFVDRLTGEVVTVEPYHVQIQRPLPVLGNRLVGRKEG